jgi:hypothetical protein
LLHFCISIACLTWTPSGRQPEPRLKV